MSGQARGQLKLYLGYAAGVGKTYQMLSDGQAAVAHGIDVVVGYFEPHARKDTTARTEGLVMIPRRQVEYRGARFEEMDTPAIVARHPKLALVDELAHSNVPGSEREKRWQDVLVLLDAGIDVWTTMNVQHLESLNDQVAAISGVRVRETLPDWVMHEASEVVMVDLTPRALLNRLERGVVYSPDKAQKALENFFRESTLSALRELALRQTAHEIEQEKPAQRENERLLIHITADPATAAVIRRGRRVADYIHAECFAVFVHHSDELSAGERDAIDRHLAFARNLHIETRLLRNTDDAAAVVEFARLHRITQIFLARNHRKPQFWRPGSNAVIKRIVRLAQDIEVTVIGER